MPPNINILAHPSPLMWDTPLGIQTEKGQEITTEQGQVIQPDNPGH